LPLRHHLVSKGYQKNFADDQQRLSIIDSHSGDVIERQRPTKRNWVEEGWASFTDANGNLNVELEREFSRIEAQVMRRIREVNVNSCGPQHRGPIINLFAIHLVRSNSFLAMRQKVHDRSLPSLLEAIAEKPELSDRFREQFGRNPLPGELLSLATASADATITTKASQVDSIAQQHNRAAETLDQWGLQVVEIDDGLPGFVISDVPVVHANLADLRFGFRDELALGDANLVLAPLTRRTLVCFTARGERHTVLRTKAKVRSVNAILARAALSEVACHPDDELEVSRLVRNPPPIKRP
jgi:hypothetical protein